MLLSALRRPPRAAAPARNQPTPGPSSPAERHPTASRPESGSIPGVPSYQRRWQVVLAVAIVGGPLAYLLGGLLAPAIHDSGQASIAANAAANPTSNALHLAAFVLASYLLPIGAIGLAGLAYPRAPWLATIAASADLLDRFSTDAVMGSYLIVYIVGHLVAYVLLGIALRRARVLPGWAAWSMIASSPLTLAAFVLPGSPRAIGGIALALLVVGSLPAARTMATWHRLPTPP